MSRRSILLASCSGQMGGMELRMVQEARLLQESGFDVQVVTPNFPQFDQLKCEFDKLGIAVRAKRFPKVFTHWKYRHVEYIRGQLFPAHRLYSPRPQLVHVFFSWTNQGLDPLWLFSMAGIPCVLSIHNAFPKTNFPPWHRKHLTPAFSSLVGYYGVSNAALEQFDTNFSSFLPANLERKLIYNSVETTRFCVSKVARQKVRAALGVGVDDLLIGSVGRLDDQKKPLSLIEVFSIVKKSLPNAYLLLVGTGPLEEAVKDRIAALNLNNSVKLIPFQDGVENFFSALDLHILLSRNEGFGIVTAEAMACGVPAVGTDVPGTQEILEGWDKTMLVPLGDHSAAAQKVVDILGLPARGKAALCVSARKHIIANFSKSAFDREVGDFYNSILNRTM